MLLCCFQRNVHDAAQQVGWSVANTRKCQREDTSHRLRPVKAFARDKECLLFGHSLLVVVVAQIFQQPVLVEWEDLRGSVSTCGTRSRNLRGGIWNCATRSTIDTMNNVEMVKWG